MTEPELHTDEAHQVIAAELVACTLGQRHRPELVMPEHRTAWETIRLQLAWLRERLSR